MRKEVLFSPGVMHIMAIMYGAMGRLPTRTAVGLDGLLFGVVKRGLGGRRGRFGLEGVHGGISRVVGVRVLGQEGNRRVDRRRRRFNKLFLVARMIAAHIVSWVR